MNTLPKLLLAGGALALVAGTTLAYAAIGERGYGFHHGHERMQEMGAGLFDNADVDSDGSVSRQEMQARLTERFSNADTDGDSSVTKAEIVEVIERNSERQFVQRYSGRIADHLVYQFDLDDDGSVTFSELDNRTGKLFAILDRNDDGKLEIAEIRRNFPQRSDRGHHFGGWWSRDHRSD